MTTALVRIPVPDLDLAATLGCGQVFHWRQAGRGFAGAIGDHAVYLEQEGESLLVTPSHEELVRHYLALDHPLVEIYAAFPDDLAVRAALDACRGLRIIRQPRWECLASFITSALKQVAHISVISHALRKRYGTHLGQIAGVDVFAYPNEDRIAALDESDLRECGLGFRARNLLEAARALATARSQTGIDRLEAIAELSRAEALNELRTLRGVGTKVANCVLLFAYGHLDAFPIDVWIERVLRERYFSSEPKTTAAQLQSFANEYFGPFGGYAQQYFFHHARLTSGRKVSAKKAIPERRPNR